MKESTYWSWVAELWNRTSMEQYRARFLNVVIWLASGKIKEGELREKMDWKRLENGFRSCWILGCETSLAGWFLLSKLGKMDEGWPSIYREANGIKRKSEWCILEGIYVGLHHEKSVTQTWSKHSQIMRFMMLITSGKLLNMIRNKNAWKSCD